MITPDMIPDEVVNAAREAWLQSDVNAKEDCRAAIAAALNAWPGVKRVKGYFTHDTDHYEPAIILPLPQKEQTND